MPKYADAPHVAAAVDRKAKELVARDGGELQAVREAIAARVHTKTYRPNTVGPLMAALELSVELGEPFASMAARQATVLLGGVTVYSELVYDTDPATGERTAEQATLNVTRLVASRLRRLLEDE